ncbi:hypothetical protein AAG570_004568 [Ranatra chinensis]|uniref:Palmitoyltransferase n=1 Tax=Ranatra chinensis TaxID=642074 RepID=A0ABD0Y192_9HEMI
MRIRPNIIPRNMRDFTACLFLVFMIPIIYWFEVFVALPFYFGGEFTIAHYIHNVISIYLLVNVVGNFVAAIMIDTSIRGEVMPSTQLPTWHFCDSCQCFVPPRSWHCSTCSTCILKRDHHCNFTACCIGHRNHRYFIMFLFYFALSTAYSTFFNLYYLWSTFSYWSTINMLKLLFPFAILVTGMDNTMEQVYRLLSVLVIVGLISSGCLLYYQTCNLLRGRVMYEKVKNLNVYNDDDLKMNLAMVLGENWYLALICPFVPSNLIHDGIHWDSEKYK